MVAELTIEKVKPVLECDISSNQAVFVPLWIAWCDSGNDADYNIDTPEKHGLSVLEKDIILDI